MFFKKFSNIQFFFGRLFLAHFSYIYPMNDFLVECCANSVQSAINGQIGGANRIELCTHLEVGGITPCKEEIIKTKKILHIPIRILIRPRAGDFIYSEN